MLAVLQSLNQWASGLDNLHASALIGSFVDTWDKFAKSGPAGIALTNGGLLHALKLSLIITCSLVTVLVLIFMPLVRLQKRNSLHLSLKKWLRLDTPGRLHGGSRIALSLRFHKSTMRTTAPLMS